MRTILKIICSGIIMGLLISNMMGAEEKAEVFKEKQVGEEGLLYTGKTLTGSSALAPREEVNKLLSEFQKLSIEELEKKLKDKDYLIRILAYITLRCSKYSKKDYQIVYPSDKGWISYIEKVLIDLKNASARKVYINIEADLVEMVLVQIGESAIPLLEKKLKDQNEPEEFRKHVIYTFSKMGKIRNKNPIKNILKSILNDKNISVKETAAKEIEILEKEK